MDAVLPRGGGVASISLIGAAVRRGCNCPEL